MAVYTIDAFYQVTRFVRHEIEAKDGMDALEKIERMETESALTLDEPFWNNAEECEDSAGPSWFELVSVKENQKDG